VIVLDTNIVSEGLRPRPRPEVIAWINAQPFESLYLCTPVLAEMCYGVEKLPEGAQRKYFAEAVDRIETSLFCGRILPLDLAAAREFGRVVARHNRMGRPIGQMDALIAAVAIANRMALATRDAADFAGLGFDVINPFEYAPPSLT
jgi:hypothetical protein